MKASIASKLDQLVDRLDEVTRLLSTEEATRDMESFRKLTREHAELTPVVEQYQAFRQCEADSARRRRAAGRPGHARTGASRAGRRQSPPGRAGAGAAKLCCRATPNDERNIFANPARERAAMSRRCLLLICSALLRFAERNRWQVEIVSASELTWAAIKSSPGWWALARIPS